MVECVQWAQIKIIELCYKLTRVPFSRRHVQLKLLNSEKNNNEMLHCAVCNARIQLIYKIVDVLTVAVLH